MLYYRWPKLPKKECEDDPFSVYMTGGITAECPDWQEQVKSALEPLPLTLYDVRPNFDWKQDKKPSKWPQLHWENVVTPKCSFFIFWFCKESVCADALLQLGRLTTASHPLKMFIGADPEYTCYTEVYCQTRFFLGEPVHDDLSELIDDVKVTIMQLAEVEEKESEDDNEKEKEESDEKGSDEDADKWIGCSKSFQNLSC